MKKHHQKEGQVILSLGDLITTVSSCSSSSRETVLAVADLLDSGRVRLQTQGRKIRARVC